MSGRVWVLGPNVDTDVLAPGKYMKSPLAELASHCLEAIDPSFARDVQAGDVIVAGKNFGLGSSREQAAEALRYLGVSAVVAPSFAGIFFRNALNLGLLAVVCADAHRVRPGQHVEIDARRGTVTVAETGKVLKAERLPDFLLEMVEAGGLIPHLERQLGGSQQK